MTRWWWFATAGALFVTQACGSDSDAGDPASTGGTGASGATGGSSGSGATGGNPGGGGLSGAGGAAGGGAAGSGGSAGAGGGAIWQPKPGTTWQWQLTGTIDTTVDAAMYDIDLVEAPQAKIDELHSLGRSVICYFSAGSREDWRPDAGEFTTGDYGKGLVGWPGETWLDVRSTNVRAIMKKRLDLAVSKGCDGVEPDNVDGYANDTGFNLSQADQLGYLSFLSTEAHSRGLSVGLKNAVDLASQVVQSFDWALDEECLSYDECASLAPFIQAQKAVFHVEYVDQESQGAAKKSSVCGSASIQGFSTLIKTWDLTAWRLTC